MALRKIIPISDAQKSPTAPQSRKQKGQKPPSLLELGRIVGAGLVSDIAKVIEQNHSSEKPATYRELGVRHFLGALLNDPQPASKLLISVYSDANASVCGHAQSIQLLIGCLNVWREESVRQNKMTKITAGHYVERAAFVFEWLGCLPDRDYPKFKRTFISFPKEVGNIQSLAELKWSELGVLKGAARERLALEFLKAEIIEKFSRLEAVFGFGQLVLSTEEPPENVNPQAWRIVKAALSAESSSWQKTGRSIVKAKDSSRNPVYPEALCDPNIWHAAGLADAGRAICAKQPEMRLSFSEVRTLVLSCLGAIYEMTLLVQALFACTCGWNPQPIVDLGRNPFLFRTHTDLGLATGEFIVSFKKRAHHDVLTYLERGSEIGGLIEENIKAECRSLATELSNDAAFLVVPLNSSLLAILYRYQAMTDKMRIYDLTQQHKDKFFFYLTRNNGLGCRQNVYISDTLGDGFLRREGVTFQAVRKSFLATTMREVGSVAATRPFAGHSKLSVLMPHYLNTSEINAELDQSIRFFQNACQALVLGTEEDRSTVLGVSPGDLSWFRRLAVAAGIAAATGFSPNPEEADLPKATIVFQPSPDNLKDLFLAHRALRKSRARVTSARWRIQALPLLACVKAIGRAVFSKGLGKAYIIAAQHAAKQLADGTIVLPPVLEA